MPNTPTAAQAPVDETQPNMAEEAGTVNTEGAQLSRADLEALGADLKHHFSLMFDQNLDAKLTPIAQELKALKMSVGETANMASKAYDMASALEGRVSEMESNEKHLKYRLVWLEARARALNFKVRGVPESTDLNANLASAFSIWLSSFLNLGEEQAPTIAAAYRAGPVAAIKPNFPRDIILQFMFAKDREAVLQAAKSVSQVQFKGTKILFLLDLPPEVLMKRKSLRPITDTLMEKKISFRWNAASDVVVVREDMQLRAGDLEAGRRLLEALNAGE